MKLVWRDQRLWSWPAMRLQRGTSRLMLPDNTNMDQLITGAVIVDFIHLGNQKGALGLCHGLCVGVISDPQVVARIHLLLIIAGTSAGDLLEYPAIPARQW